MSDDRQQWMLTGSLAGPLNRKSAERLLLHGCKTEPGGCTHVAVRDVVFGPWRVATAEDLAVRASGDAAAGEDGARSVEDGPEAPGSAAVTLSVGTPGTGGGDLTPSSPVPCPESRQR